MAFTITIQPVGGWVLNDMTQPAVFTGGLAAFGPKGDDGAPGAPGEGVPTGGAVGQVLVKTGTADYATDWAAVPNPFDQVLNIGSSVVFGDLFADSLEITGFGSGLSFPDSTLQTTAFIPSDWYPSTNPSGYITSAALAPYLLSATASATYQPLSGMSSYLTTSAASATYYPLTNPAGYITSSALSGYATESFVTSQGYITSSALAPYLLSSTASATYQPISGMSAYLTTASASATYYPLSNPAGYISDIPAASTTVAGKVELATMLEAHTGSSTTLAVTPDDLAFRIHSGSTLYLTPSDSSATVSGGTTFTDSQGMGVRCGTASGSYGLRVFAGNTTNGFNSTVGGGSSAVNYDKRAIFSGKATVTSSSDAGNYAQRVQYGKTQTNTPIGNLNAKGFGIRSTGAGNALALLVHNGTTLTAVTSSFTPTAGASFDFQIHSDGAGNVTLYVNGSSVATSSAGPTGASGSLPCVSVESEATAAVSSGTNSSLLVCNLRLSFDL